MSLTIRTFGGFDLISGSPDAPKTPIRNSGMWMALKYFIAYQGKPVPADKLIDILWPDGDSADPMKALNDIIYRLRKTLTAYGGSQQYIGFSHGSYSWTPDDDCVVDAMMFERLLLSARDVTKNKNERVSLYNQAIDLYRGEFLSESASEPWVIGCANHYRRLFLQAVDELANLYEPDFEFEEIILLYNKAIIAETKEESLYVRQIQLLIKTGEYDAAKRQYRQIEKILRREFDAKPSKLLRSLLDEITKAPSRGDEISEIKAQLETSLAQKGAILCGPETFRQIYCFDRRFGERAQLTPYIWLCLVVVVTDDPGRPIDEKELRNIMKTLRNIMLRTLRKGDIVCQYSPGQFALMLTTSEDANPQVALNRIKWLFEREYGTSRVELLMQVSAVEGEG